MAFPGNESIQLTTLVFFSEIDSIQLMAQMATENIDSNERNTQPEKLRPPVAKNAKFSPK